MIASKKLLVIAGGNYIYGAEKVTLAVIKGLRDVGYEIQVIISGWGDGQFAEALINLQIKFYKLKLGWYYTSKTLWSLDSLIHYPGAVIRFLRIRKNFKDWPVYIISFRQVILLWPFFNKNIVYHVHDANAGSKQSRFFLRIITKKVARFIAVSEFIKTDLVACGIPHEKIEVIYNGVDILPYVEKDFSDKANLTIGIVGQVIERKGHLTLLQAIKILIKKGLDIELIIAGDGNIGFMAKLNSLIEDEGLPQKIIWRGFKSNLIEIYDGIDVLIAPTVLPEPFGLIVLEANMLGIPVIASNSGGFIETIKNGVTGFLTESGNADKLSEKIEFFYKNRRTITEMGKQARKNVIEKFSSLNMIDSIDKLIY